MQFRIIPRNSEKCRSIPHKSAQFEHNSAQFYTISKNYAPLSGTEFRNRVELRSELLCIIALIYTGNFYLQSESAKSIPEKNITLIFAISLSFKLLLNRTISDIWIIYSWTSLQILTNTSRILLSISWTSKIFFKQFWDLNFRIDLTWIWHKNFLNFRNLSLTFRYVERINLIKKYSE